MRLSKLWAILAPAALLLAIPAHSFADQFSIQYLTTDNHTFLGLSSTGTAYFDYIPSSSYTSYFNGVAVTSSAPPSFTADNGSACAPAAPSGAQLSSARCNGGFDAYSATFNSNPAAHLYWGAAAQDIWGTGVGSFAPVASIFALNSIGDIIFDDQGNGNWYEAMDLTTPPVALLSRDSVSATTPEPASVLLLSTGILASIFVIRRRRIA